MNSKEVESISEHGDTRIVCWTKVQNLARETFEEIVQRKEFEKKLVTAFSFGVLARLQVGI